jgi:hypothetical protein
MYSFDQMFRFVKQVNPSESNNSITTATAICTTAATWVNHKLYMLESNEDGFFLLAVSGTAVSCTPTNHTGQLKGGVPKLVIAGNNEQLEFCSATAGVACRLTVSLMESDR